MYKTLRKVCIVLGLTIIGNNPLFAQVGQRKSLSPFDEYPQVAQQVFVTDLSLFTAYRGPSVARLNVPEFEERARIGIVNLASKTSVYVDRIDNLVHGPASFEITDAKTGMSLGRFNLGLISPSNSDAKLLFNGQGVVYLHHVPPSICFGRATRKFMLGGKRLVETQQAIAYLNTDSEVFGDVKLFSSPDGTGSAVASLQEGAKVSVIGIAVDSIELNQKKGQNQPTLLIKTPLGLVGWYLPGRSGAETAGILITQCN
jgi:hypothetical protein